MLSKALIFIALFVSVPITQVTGFPAETGQFIGTGFLANNVFDEEIRVYDRVNVERGRHRLQSLGWDDKLADLARAYSAKMARESFFGHWDPNGKTVVDRASRARIKGWRMIGENLFLCRGVRDVTGSAITGWMNSETHRENILDPKWTSTGVGIARARDGSIYITQVFVER